MSAKNTPQSRKTELRKQRQRQAAEELRLRRRSVELRICTAHQAERLSIEQIRFRLSRHADRHIRRSPFAASLVAATLSGTRLT